MAWQLGGAVVFPRRTYWLARFAPVAVGTHDVGTQDTGIRTQHVDVAVGAARAIDPTTLVGNQSLVDAMRVSGFQELGTIAWRELRSLAQKLFHVGIAGFRRERRAALDRPAKCEKELFLARRRAHTEHARRLA